MTRWWKHVAILAAWLALGVTAQAQPGYPSPVGATRIPEPLRYTPSETQPNLVPGPLTPEMAPVGPPNSLNLPAGHTGAFQLENYPTEAAAYAALGSTGLRRQRLTHLPIAFTDNQSAGFDTGVVPTGIGTRANGAFNPHQTNSGFLPTALNLNDINPSWTYGGRLTLGYLFGNEAIEVTGFYNPDSSADKVATNQGRLFVPFGPLANLPAGFEGNNGLWLQSDRVKTTFTNEIANGEINYRVWSPAVNRTELIMGVRYFYSKEKIDIATDDDYLTTDIFGARDRNRAASYSVSTRNNLAAFQFGGEYSAPIPSEYLSWIWFTGMFKGAMGPNFIERNQSLTRGDGYTAINVNRSSVRFGTLTEVSGFIDIHFLERVRLRGGYMALYGTGFSTAGAQVDYDLSNQGRRGTDSGTVFWHGPVAELHFLF